MAGARGCFNCGGCAWCFCVVAAVVSSSRALCADACTYSHLFPPPFLVVVHGAVLTGTATFLFFYELLYIDRAQSKLLSKIHVVCIVTGRVRVENTSRTPGCELPEGGHTYLVKSSYSDQMTPSCESLTRAILSCACSLLAITVSLPAFLPLFVP